MIIPGVNNKEGEYRVYEDGQLRYIRYTRPANLEYKVYIYDTDGRINAEQVYKNGKLAYTKYYYY
ncbi:hypothetical protein D5b_00258 [Faustovirus]|nr:hypothetical protein D5b_00258 [Faustovirus]AMN84656.1 hypothetical protein D6_00253 [Faustovirus]AMP44210.1 hypothetical protein PRJ_Dakar_00254 [Faustovirus]QKE50340.1 hypothetical protein F-VV10_0220 [Faustovirus]